MRRLAIVLLAISLAAPAGAQIVGERDYGDFPRADRLGPDGRMASPSPGREARAIRRDIHRLRESGAISRQEARRLSREARMIGRSGDPLSSASARALEAQVLALRFQVYVAPTQPRRGR